MEQNAWRELKLTRHALPVTSMRRYALPAHDLLSLIRVTGGWLVVQPLRPLPHPVKTGPTASI
jgi:hypothetical protein